jgi:tripartite-type tricarboxylate transporter receptor subunit TctC
MGLRLVVSIGAALFAVQLTGGPAPAQDFPTRQVTLVVPLGAGGSMDIIARTLGPKLAERLGKPVVIENRTGGGTVIAANTVAKSPPDGHTLLIAPSGTLTTNATLYKKLPYDPIKDFAPIALYVKVPFILVVDPALPVRSVADLVKLAKDKQLSYGSTGIGAAPHLAGELLKSALGIEMTHVPYKGMVQILADIVAGHIQVAFGDPAIATQLSRDGKVRALGVSSLVRMPSAPEIPTLAEAGIPGFEAVSWHLVVAPAGTPKPVVDRLHAELKAIMATPEITQQLVAMGLIPVDSPPTDELQRFVAAELDRWGKLVQKAGIAGSQ